MTLPKFLELTDEKLAEISDQQKEFRKAARVPVRMSTDEERVSFAIRREQSLRETLRQMYKERVPKERCWEVRDMIAGALMEQGRLHEALGAAKSKEVKAEIRKLIKAVERPDDEVCGCPKGGQLIQVPETELAPASVSSADETLITVRGMPSEKHNMEMRPVKICSLCGDVNVA